MSSYILVESAMGYALFVRKTSEEINTSTKEVQKTIANFATFSNMVKFVSFAPFETPEHGLDNINSISEGVLHQFLRQFLESNLKGQKGARLGVIDNKLSAAIQDALGLSCISDDTTIELSRGVRMHLHKFIKDVKPEDIEKAQLGLGHAYSRAKVKFNINKADNMVMQSIAMLDQLDKDLNTFAMRLREWYAWHFPELNKLIKDNVMFAKLVKVIRDKTHINDESVHAITQVTQDESLAEEVVAAGKSSMGLDLNEFDMLNIDTFATKVVSLAEYRKQLYDYLQTKMHTVAPNLTVLLGEQVGARLISHAGSLTNLAKYPASTIQILGAEKALFRALKTRGKTPKYGLLYHSTFIGRASKQNKGKISRYLANKCAVASRLDCFQDFPTTKYGEKLKEQVEERLSYYESGGKGMKLQKNVDLMKEVKEDVKKEMKEKGVDETASPKKRKRDEMEVEEDTKEEAEESKTPSKKQKKEKKDKKKDKKTPKKKEESDSEEEAPKKKEKKTPKKADSDEEEEETPKKKQKKEKKDKKDKKKTPKKEESEEEESPKKKKEKKEKKDKKKTPKKKAADSDDE